MKYHHLSIWTAVIFNQVLGFVWYSDALFLNAWTAASGQNYHFLNPTQLPFFASIIASAMFCYLVSWLFQMLVIDDWFRGLLIGLLIGTGFIAPNLGAHYLSMGFPPELIWVDALREILGSGAMGIILAVWRADISTEEAKN